MRTWYDGSRIGDEDVYNPWSVLNYLDRDCEPRDYWGNTSGNVVLGQIVFSAGERTTVLYKREIIERFSRAVGGIDRYYRLHDALREGGARSLRLLLEEVLLCSVSFFDMLSESSAHMLMVGLCYGMAGYEAPVSNRESGDGRFDLRLVPLETSGLVARRQRPVITVEFKFERAKNPDSAGLQALADSALAQIAEKNYDSGPLPAQAAGRVRWGIAFAGKRVAVACERLA